METYTFIVSVALFFGMMGIILMMERRRGSDLAQFEKLQQTLSACLASLQANQSQNEAHMAQAAAAISQLHAAIQSGTTVSQASFKELAERLEWFAKQLTSATQMGSQELLVEAQRTTGAIKAFETSMKESVKF